MLPEQVDFNEHAPPTPEPKMILQTKQLTKRFGQLTAVDQLGLEVHRGDVFGLLGPNGSGKTTTIRMVFDLVRPNAGEIHLFGQPLTSAAARHTLLRRASAMIEQPTFYPFLSGRDNLRGIATFACMPDNKATRQRIAEVLELVGLSERAKDAYKKYSLGMKQRLGIAAALLNRPELIILDEPTNGLDPAGVVEIRRLVKQLAQQGITVIISSHLLYEIQQTCSRVAIIKLGHLLYQGEVQSLLATNKSITLSFQQPEMLQSANQIVQAASKEDSQRPWLRGCNIARAEGNLWIPPGAQILRVNTSIEHAIDINRLLAEHGIYATEIRQQQSDLEQFFLEVTGNTAGL
ncbi:MAG TPA: ATP-binding cassette domain-containing protein [Ktedonobacteraceae bacterium]|jgi:ABC-2 type transport system ATP-binding protein|nr:ATP-binding cassette domain-containing protein [Ktedonobacteraceae bacterium]